MHEFHNITDMFIELGALGSPSGPVSIAIQTIKGQRGGTNGRQRIEEHCIDTLCGVGEHACYCYSYYCYSISVSVR